MKATGTVPLQLSDAVIAGTAGTSARHWIVRLAGLALSTGAVVSLTVIFCVYSALLPQASVAVQVRVMLLLQLEPGLLSVVLKVTGSVPAQLSVAVTEGAPGTSLRH